MHQANDLPHPIARLPTELLEEILSHVDLRSLLRCQRVCSLWNACIPGTSASIRAAMFLPSVHDKIIPQPVTLHFTVNISVSFLDLFPYTEPPMSYTLDMPAKEVLRLREERGVLVHPLLTAGMEQGRIQQCVREWKSLHDERWRCEEPGSWTEMLACYPPVRKIGVRFTYEDDEPVLGFIEYDLHADEGDVVGKNGEGVRLGDFLIEITKLINIP